MGIFKNETLRLGIDIGSTTVKVAILDETNNILFSDYERHYANIQECLAGIIKSPANYSPKYNYENAKKLFKEYE